jgi:hypothetical protein
VTRMVFEVQGRDGVSRGRVRRFTRGLWEADRLLSMMVSTGDHHRRQRDVWGKGLLKTI